MEISALAVLPCLNKLSSSYSDCCRSVDMATKCSELGSAIDVMVELCLGSIYGPEDRSRCTTDEEVVPCLVCRYECSLGIVVVVVVVIVAVAVAVTLIATRTLRQCYLSIGAPPLYSELPRLHLFRNNPEVPFYATTKTDLERLQKMLDLDRIQTSLILSSCILHLALTLSYSYRIL